MLYKKDEASQTRTIATLLLIGALLLTGGFVVKQFLLGSPIQVVLQSSDPFVGAISQSLAGTQGTSVLPKNGTDFMLENTARFDNGQWVVTSIKPLGNNAEKSVVVLNNSSGLYQVVIGPGTSFPVTQLSGLPADVAQYLKDLGLTYVPAK